MLILLPPSEGKRTPKSGRALNLGKLFAASALKEARESALGKNPQIDTTICRPAHEIYSGVLYQSLDWESLSATATKKGEASLLIISAIFGALRITDVIPTYKAKIKSALWKEPLTELLALAKAHFACELTPATKKDPYYLDLLIPA